MKIGFIGAGNMGSAIIRGYLDSGAGTGSQITAYDNDSDKLAALARKTGVKMAYNIQDLVLTSEIIILAVKPQNYDEVLTEVAYAFKRRQIIISMAAGISMKYIEGFLGEDSKIVRIMPNTPALVGEGMTAMCHNLNVSVDEFEQIMEIFWTIGKAVYVDEALMDSVVGVSGSSPAYVFMFIDALTKGAVQNGMDEEDARVLAAQSVLGAAKMVLETGEDPEVLRRNVCSPGGATIEAVEYFQSVGFENSIIQGMQAAIDKSKKMTK